MSQRIDKKKAKAIAKEHGYLQYMIERYLALWGEAETLRFIQACEYPVRTSIRVNTLKTSIDELQSRLQVLDRDGALVEIDVLHRDSQRL